MTKTLFAAIIFAVAALTITGCKKSSSTSVGTGKSFYMKLDGTEFTPAGGGRYYALTGSIPGIQIVGDTSYMTIEIYVPSDAVGTYNLDHTGSSNFASVFVNAGSKVYLSTSGEVKITKSAGGKISGTFHYAATGTSGTVNVTDGEFNDIPKK